MNKLIILVCENSVLEYQTIVQQEGFDDVIIKPLPCMCADKRNIADALRLLNESANNGDDVLVLCSQYCEILKPAKAIKSVKVRQTNHCFNHLTNEGIIEYIIGKGGYLIGSGWLNHWEEHIKTQGFDRQTAINFYKSSCKELVFFDTGVNKKAKENLHALSDYLELPYKSIAAGLETVRYILKSMVFEWRLQNQREEHVVELSKAQAQCAEYSAILDLIGKISTYKSQRDTIDGIKEIFTMVMGAQSFRYSSMFQDESDAQNNSQAADCPEEKTYQLNKEENEFCIKINHNGKSFGSIHVGGFLFPQYIEKYLSFAIEIVKICGLVLSDNEQYEKILESEQKMKYLSSHDSLTGLYNRAYFDDMTAKNQNINKKIVFMFDIDKLKLVNDNFGHAEGDKLIYNFATIIKDSFRENDIVARIGGDEFTAIMFDADGKMAKTVKERILEAIKRYNQSIEPHLKLSVSIGYVALEDNNETIETAMKKADVIMYAEKTSKTICR